MGGYWCPDTHARPPGADLVYLHAEKQASERRETRFGGAAWILPYDLMMIMPEHVIPGGGFIETVYVKSRVFGAFRVLSMEEREPHEAGLTHPASKKASRALSRRKVLPNNLKQHLIVRSFPRVYIQLHAVTCTATRKR